MRESIKKGEIFLLLEDKMTMLIADSHRIFLVLCAKVLSQTVRNRKIIRDLRFLSKESLKIRE